MKVVWQTPASLDLVALVENHTAYSVSFANAILDRIETQMALLERFPYIGRSGQVPGTRERTVPCTPYVIIYQIDQGELFILNILHGARNFPIDPA